MRHTVFAAALIAALCFCGNAAAQKKGPNVGLWYQASAASLDGKSELKNFDLLMAPGYSFSRSFFVRLQGEFYAGLFEIDGTRDWEMNFLIGPTIGYNIIKRAETAGIVEVAGTAGTTTTKNTWNFFYYDLTLRWHMPSKFPGKLSFGLGARYYQSKDSLRPDYLHMTVGLGFHFN